MYQKSSCMLLVMKQKLVQGTTFLRTFPCFHQFKKLEFPKLKNKNCNENDLKVEGFASFTSSRTFLHLFLRKPYESSQHTNIVTRNQEGFNVMSQGPFGVAE